MSLKNDNSYTESYLSNSPNFVPGLNTDLTEIISELNNKNQINKTVKEPFVGDVSEGKSDPVYQVHSYHTKVPHKAIMNYVDYYTNEGDIVLDAFCGSGMTGIACSQLNRHAVLSDLSPFASFMAYNLNNIPNINFKEFYEKAQKICNEVEEETLWAYKVTNTDSYIKHGLITEVFRCNYCDYEFPFSDIALEEDGCFNKKLVCKSCGAELEQKKLNKVYDNSHKPVRKYFKLILKNGDVLYEYLDVDLKDFEIPYWYPTEKYYFKGHEFGDMFVRTHHSGLVRVTDFFTKRNLYVLSALLNRIKKETDNQLRHTLMFIFTSVIQRASLLNRLRPSGAGDPLNGTLYIASLIREDSPISLFRNKLKAYTRAYKTLKRPKTNFYVQTCSVTNLDSIPNNAIDYIFTDPPFGRNIMYSELNFLIESWLQVYTNNKKEAVKNKSQGKGVYEYRYLMYEAFREYYRVLKPNCWMTVVFHNSEAIIWNCIQEALSKAGFVVAQVGTLDKKQGSYKQVTEAGSVKNDLVINSYKPDGHFKKMFLKRAGSNMEKEFINQHLSHLTFAGNIERSEQMLYSKMLAYYIQHGYEINMNAKQFYSMLSENFYERDGYWFTEKQVKTYEEKKKQNKLRSKDIADGALFIVDEKSAIAWLNYYLNEPKPYSDIYIEFAKLLTVSEDQIPELKQLLEENFVSEGGKYRRPEVLEKKDIEERREKRLSKEFDQILETAKSSKKLKDVRKEAIIVGFTHCYKEKRFEDIIKVGKKLPARIVESSTEIFDFIDIAETKLGVI